MSIISEVDWSKLEPYESGRHKSFEELYYQLISNDHKADLKSGATITSIDDSGGGDGVEFYLTFPNGDVWGWQAKYFGRLENSQKEQVKTSLKKAYKVHGTKLKRWTLCSKLDLTPDERGWFDDKLASSKKEGETVLPENHEVKLIHSGTSALLKLLAENPHVHNYFFKDKLLTPKWFADQKRVLENDPRIKSKYVTELYLDTYDENTIGKALCGQNIIPIFDEEFENGQVEMYQREYNDAVNALLTTEAEKEYQGYQQVFRSFAAPHIDVVNSILKDIYELKEMTVNLRLFDADYSSRRQTVRDRLHKLNKYIQEYDKKIDDTVGESLHDVEHDSAIDHKKMSPQEIAIENKKRSKARGLLFGPFYALEEYAYSSLLRLMDVFDMADKSEVHITSAAGMGKTNLAFDIFKTHIENKLPAIFIFGKEVTDVKELHKCLDVSANWQLEEFLGALDVAGAVTKSRVPIIIDGLNESSGWKTIWGDSLASLINLIATKYRHLVLITTYRSSYEDYLFPDNYFQTDDRWRSKIYLHGFNGLTRKAIELYFEYYKLDVQNFSPVLNEFSHPLYLKLFCEVKNPLRQQTVKITSVSKEDIFDVFDEYIAQCNSRITSNLKGLDKKYSKKYTSNKLYEYASAVWNADSRGVGMDTGLFSNEELRAFEGEDLLVYRDILDGQEQIQFTYDLLAGYIIASALIKANPLQELAKSDDFKLKILNRNSRHPLFNDILRSLIVVGVKRENKFLFEILDDEFVANYCMEALFEIDANYLRENKAVARFVKECLEKEGNLRRFLELSKSCDFEPSHPFNFAYWSDVLKQMRMVDRDLVWSEKIRTDYSEYSDHLVESLYERCRGDNALTERTRLAALKVMWILTTTRHRLRDEATRAIYWYGRKMPTGLFDLMEQAIEVDDPYVFERVMAAAYGVAMAFHGMPKSQWVDDFNKKELSTWGRFLFDRIFAKAAPNPTTHILTRDYAKRIIDISLMHNDKILTKDEQRLITYPLSKYPHTTWKISKDKDSGKYRDGNAPIGMDFENYTVGGLVEGRAPYDNLHVEYKKVMGNIYWRLYDLGYSLKAFGEIDKQIAVRGGYSRSGNKSESTDRYGKKYSWIAFFECAGRRSDDGLLKDFDGELEVRISEVDIDPSFPVELRETDFYKRLGNRSLIGDLSASTEDWLNDGSELDESKYLFADELEDESGSWILLNGRISQKDSEETIRDVYLAISAVIVDDADYKKVTDFLNKHQGQYFRFSIPDNTQSFYTFAGELPWSELMPDDYTRPFYINLHKKHDDGESISIQTTPTTYESAWESYHSAIIPSNHTLIPVKPIARQLATRLMPQSSDLIDKNDEKVSLAFSSAMPERGHSSFLYIKRDVIDKYLAKNNKRMIWFRWAEKRWFENGISNYSNRSSKSAYVEHCNIIPYEP